MCKLRRIECLRAGDYHGCFAGFSLEQDNPDYDYVYDKLPGTGCNGNGLVRHWFTDYGWRMLGARLKRALKHRIVRVLVIDVDIKTVKRHARYMDSYQVALPKRYGFYPEGV